MARDSRNIYLVGFMGSGKTRQGELLARALKRPFVDTDRLIIEQHGLSISEIFERFGEPYFRTTELATLADLARRSSHVISVGGGTVVRDEVWPLLQSSGVSIYLRRSIDQLVEQLRKFDNRPLLKNVGSNGLRDHVTQMLQVRESYYLRADLVFECQDGWEREETARHLLAFVEANL